MDEVLDLVQCLVVHFVKEGFEAAQHQPLVGFAVGTQEFFFQPVLDGYRANVGNVEDIEYHHVCVAPIGGDEEPTHLITGGGAIDGMCMHENNVGVRVMRFLGSADHVIVDVEVGPGR